MLLKTEVKIAEFKFDKFIEVNNNEELSIVPTIAFREDGEVEVTACEGKLMSNDCKKVVSIPMHKVPYEGKTFNTYVNSGSYLNKSDSMHCCNMADIKEDFDNALKKALKLAEANRELGEIRATLLVNFGDVPRNKYGFVIKDEGQSTHKILIEVLDKLVKRGDVQK